MGRIKRLRLTVDDETIKRIRAGEQWYLFTSGVEVDVIHDPIFTKWYADFHRICQVNDWIERRHEDFLNAVEQDGDDKDKTVIIVCDEAGEAHATCEVYTCYDVHYATKVVKTEDMQKLIPTRFTSIVNLYVDWCYKFGVKPNMDEGWFKSKPFTEYRRNITNDKQDYDQILWVCNVTCVN